MKAVLLTGHGGLERLVYRDDLSRPEPADGEVLIEVGAAGVNNTDLWTREGAYGAGDDPQAVGGWRRDEAMAFPRVQGMDIAGRIVAAGEGVRGARIGERVLVDPVVYDAGSGREGLAEAEFIGSERDGGFAEYVTVPSPNAHAIETSLTDEELATFPTAYLTALGMLNRARLAEGEVLLVTGASGGVGSAALQLARARGARPVAIVGAGKEDRARNLGAEAVVARGTAELSTAVQRAVGQPVDVVADVVGGEAFPELLNAMRPFGRYVTAGAIAGPLVSLDLRTLYLKHLELIGSTLGTSEEFSDLVEHVAQGRVKPLLAGVYPLSQIKEAQRAFEDKDFFGKLVIVPSE